MITAARGRRRVTRNVSHFRRAGVVVPAEEEGEMEDAISGSPSRPGETVSVQGPTLGEQAILGDVPGCGGLRARNARYPEAMMVECLGKEWVTDDQLTVR
ncbi:hypothetical protein NDU88_006644 [Pleurodeles waltl]|uniref:Uncharacterized protein n=1 Tax=Pleurodeles waltl TaxID=8319 RepID=A0AAV7WFE9_PLEWA|nr:hypothetical protein NDU88_006644 [Pleurodeles waltl]